MPWRRMGEWMYRSTFSWPRHYLEMSSNLHAPVALPRGKKSPDTGTHYIVGWVGPRTGLDDEQKRSCPYRDSNSEPIDRPACSQSIFLTDWRELRKRPVSTMDIELDGSLVLRMWVRHVMGCVNSLGSRHRNWPLSLPESQLCLPKLLIKYNRTHRHCVPLFNGERDLYPFLFFADRERLHHKGAINTASSANIGIVLTGRPWWKQIIPAGLETRYSKNLSKPELRHVKRKGTGRMEMKTGEYMEGFGSFSMRYSLAVFPFHPSPRLADWPTHVCIYNDTRKR
jgi:hypothetical protein